MANPLHELSAVLTATQVNALATTAITVETLLSSADIVYLPVQASISKAAGTAYTVSSPGRIEIYDEDGNIWFSFNAVGLLDQTAAKGRAQWADLQGVNAGNSTLYIRSVGTLASGTGSVAIKIVVQAIPVLYA